VLEDLWEQLRSDPVLLHLCWFYLLPTPRYLKSLSGICSTNRWTTDRNSSSSTSAMIWSEISVSYRILNNLVLFDILVALFPIVQMNQHVGEIVIKLKALLLLQLLHLLDLLLLLDGHMWHLIIHCLLIVLLINLLRVLVLGVNSLIYHSFLFDVIFKVFVLVFLADILI